MALRLRGGEQAEKVRDGWPLEGRFSVDLGARGDVETAPTTADPESGEGVADQKPAGDEL